MMVQKPGGPPCGRALEFTCPILSVGWIEDMLGDSKLILNIFWCLPCSVVKWNVNDESMHFKLNIMENVTTALVFIIVVVNVFITAFGVQKPNTNS